MLNGKEKVGVVSAVLLGLAACGNTAPREFECEPGQDISVQAQGIRASARARVVEDGGATFVAVLDERCAPDAFDRALREERNADVRVTISRTRDLVYPPQAPAEDVTGQRTEWDS